MKQLLEKASRQPSAGLLAAQFSTNSSLEAAARRLTFTIYFTGCPDRGACTAKASEKRRRPFARLEPRIPAPARRRRP
eukprot:tig00021017_g17217.t1